MTRNKLDFTDDPNFYNFMYQNKTNPYLYPGKKLNSIKSVKYKRQLIGYLNLIGFENPDIIEKAW
jgi:hypothetical protein